MRDFREPKEWEKAHNLTVAIYQVTQDFPEEELLGLTQQIRLASAHVPIKIAQNALREASAKPSRGKGGATQFPSTGKGFSN